MWTLFLPTLLANLTESLSSSEGQTLGGQVATETGQ